MDPFTEEDLEDHSTETGSPQSPADHGTTMSELSIKNCFSGVTVSKSKGGMKYVGICNTAREAVVEYTPRLPAADDVSPGSTLSSSLLSNGTPVSISGLRIM